MNPKLAYLIDDSYGWDEGPHWKFYTEDDVPSYEIAHGPNDKVKRIVYWEIDDE